MTEGMTHRSTVAAGVRSRPARAATASGRPYPIARSTF